MTTGRVILPIPGGVAPDTSPAGRESYVSTAAPTAGTPPPKGVQYTFDGATDEYWMWNFQLPSDYLSGGVVKLVWAARTVTGDVLWKAGINSIDPSAEDFGASVFNGADFAAASTVPTTMGWVKETTVTLTATGLNASEQVTIFIGRNASSATDTASGGDALLRAATFEYASSVAIVANDLGDVDTVTSPPTGGDTFTFDGTSGLWVPGAMVPAGPAGGTTITGSYPDQVEVAAASITDAHISPTAAIQITKTNAALDGPTGSPSLRQSVFPNTDLPGWRLADHLGGGYGNSAALANLVTYYARLWVPEPETWDAIAIQVVTASIGAGSGIRMALYGDKGDGLPGGAIYTDLGFQGTTVGNNAFYTFPFPASRAMSAGPVIAALKIEGGPTTGPILACMLNNASVGHWAGPTTGNPLKGGNAFLTGGTAGAFPDPAPAVQVTANQRPMVWARVLSRP